MARKPTNNPGQRGLFSVVVGDSLEEMEVTDEVKIHRFSASLVSQGANRFYTLTMPVDILANNSTVDIRENNPRTGFQRVLDKKRAESIAEYINNGNTIPCSIILSAQEVADFRYDRPRKLISFRAHPSAFLILDGQHRVYGFSLLNSEGSVKREDLYRVPVVIYSNLNRTQECRLFIDINTKQRPVPNELLLDIKRLADLEKGRSAILHDVFDLFHENPDSPLLGRMSPAAKAHGKISRVTFDAAAAPTLEAFEDQDPAYIYSVLSAYLHAWMAVLRQLKAEANISNPTLFRAILLLFRDVATRASDRHSGDLKADHFLEFLEPLSVSVKRQNFFQPGRSHKAIYDNFSAALRRQVSLGRKR